MSIFRVLMIAALPFTWAISWNLGLPLGIPAQVEAYYENFNFVSSFSTPKERKFLLGFEDGLLQRYPLNSPFPPVYREESARQAEIFQRLLFLSSVLLRMDEGFVMRVGPPEEPYPSPDNPYLATRSGSRAGVDSIPPELLEVVSIQQAGDRVLVTLEVHRIPEETNLLWVSAYDGEERWSEALPDLMSRFEAVGGEIARTEIHEWVFVGEDWKLREARLVLTQ